MIDIKKDNPRQMLNKLLDRFIGQEKIELSFETITA